MVLVAACAGLKKVQILETLALLAVSWREDLEKLSPQIKDSQAIEKLQQVTAAHPSAKDFAISIFVCMAAEVLLREIVPENTAQTASDCRQLTIAFLPNQLKIPKCAVPRKVITAVEKLMKDSTVVICFR